VKQSTTYAPASRSAELTEHREARLGLRVAALLNERAADPDHAIAERLRFAREQALARARSTQVSAAPVVVGSSARGVGLLAAPSNWFFRMASVLPLLLLVAGLVAIDEWSDRAEIEAAADVDTALLGDDLPPDAYSDPGFAEFLKTSRE
jgi:Protein of unknown function (DUF3619)